MSAFINWKKDFGGKAATEAAQKNVTQKLVTLSSDVEGINVCNDEAILKDGKAVGYVCSGGYGHRVAKSLAMAYVSAEYAIEGCVLEVEILGEFYPVHVLAEALYDASGSKMRG